MKTKRMFLTLSVGLLALSALGGTAFAHWSPEKAAATYEKIADTLSEDQAAGEARDAAIAAKLAQLVEAGALTQTEADEIQAWYDGAPDALESTPQLRGGHADLERVAELLGMDIETLQMVTDDARRDVRTEAYTAMLDAVAADGRLTQEEADERLQAFENRPQREAGERGQRGFGPHHRGGFGGCHGMRGMPPAGVAPKGGDSVDLAA